MNVKNPQVPRVYEKDTDALFLRLFREDRDFRCAFLEKVLDAPASDGEIGVAAQTRHRGNTGSIDLELRLPNRTCLLIENKIDAGFSTTRGGLGQVARYVESVRILNEGGHNAKSILLAPRVYRTATKELEGFDSYVDYEDLRNALRGRDRELLDAAIDQAAAPYEPVPNSATASFFDRYETFSGSQFPSLVIKRNPNANGIRPTGSHTIYFEVSKTLSLYPGVPKPRMSLQCWDSGAPSASIKIMVGGWGRFSSNLNAPSSLSDIGAYLRPAGKSLGFVIDTPLLDTQIDVNAQLTEVTEGLEAGLRLQSWWNNNGAVLRRWAIELTDLNAVPR